MALQWIGPSYSDAEMETTSGPLTYQVTLM